MFGRERAYAVFGNVAGIEHGAHGVRVHRDDLRHLMRGAKAVEEMDHRYASCQCRHLRDQREVLGFLRRVGGKQRAAGGTAGHHVGMITEDRQRMRRQCACRHVQHEGRQLAGDLVQVGNEQQQPLAGSKAGGQCAGRQRAMQRAGGTGFRLHLDDLGHRAPQIGLALRGPFVRPLAHVRRRRDGVDRNDFVAEIGHAGNGFVAIDGERGCCRFIGFRTTACPLRVECGGHGDPFRIRLSFILARSRESDSPATTLRAHVAVFSVAYSSRSASTGLSRAARMAGTTPAASPISIDASSAPRA